MSDKFLKYLIAFIALAILLLSPQAVKADAIVSPRVFTRGSFVYVVEPQRVVFLSMDTRSSHTLYIAEDEHFTIVSAVRSDDVIWISNNMGAVIALNMQTGGIEEFGRGLAGEGGQLDVDRRFLWVASSDTLHRMDLTSREWVALSIPGNDISVRGIITFNDQVHIIAADAVYILNAVSEDWVVVPHRDFVLKDGDFY
ncbi:MAG: hypothetical protein LBU70_08225, partial [Chitinispirillales bacterium]|nr:hypothetical protein [Chitinispirillales bacterium]